MTDPDDAIWYIGIKGEQTGPFTADAVREKLANGEASLADSCWNESMGDQWKTISDVEEFAPAQDDEDTDDAAPEAAADAAPQTPVGPNPAVEFLKKSWADLQTLLADPDEGAKRVAESQPLIFAGAIILLAVVCAAIHPLYYRTPFLRSLLHAVVQPAAWFGVIFAALAILRAKATWQNALVFAGISMLPVAAAGLVSVALGWASLTIVMILAPFAMIGQALLLAHLFEAVAGASRRATLYTVPILAVVVYGVIPLLFR